MSTTYIARFGFGYIINFEYLGDEEDYEDIYDDDGLSYDAVNEFNELLKGSEFKLKAISWGGEYVDDEFTMAFVIDDDILNKTTKSAKEIDAFLRAKHAELGTVVDGEFNLILSSDLSLVGGVGFY